MAKLDRRELLRAGAAAGFGVAVGSPLARAWASAPAARLLRRAATIRPAGSDLGAVDHLIFLVMENRSYDHYFGAYPKGRGFDDHPKHSLGAFAQPYPGGGSLKPPKVLLPFHLDSSKGYACTEDIGHGWGTQHSSWDGGKMDGFVKAHVSGSGGGGVSTMGYYRRKDLPYHWSLADTFTLCDGYHCAVLGPTHPNRLMAVCGTIDPAGTYGGPITSTNSNPGYQWSLTCTTVQELLEDAGISWKYYNPSNVNPPLKYADLASRPEWNPALYNPSSDPDSIGVGDNILPYFKSFESPSSSLYQKAFLPSFPGDFFNDVTGGKLPSVSWIGPPVGYDEHPNSSARNGAFFISMVLDGLLQNPAVWAKTALFITYDENGGFFDHIPPPTAPPGTPGEWITAPNPSPSSSRNQVQNPRGPIGLGPRVPMFVVSPFSRGGHIASETFDHTSHLQLISARFGVQVPNVSNWRRKTVGDLSSTLFNSPVGASAPKLPETAIYMPSGGPCDSLSQETDSGGAIPTVPTHQSMPTQGLASRRMAVTIEVLPGRGPGTTRVLLSATGGVLHHVEVDLLHRGWRVSRVMLPRLGSRPRVVALHHRAHLRTGKYALSVRADGHRYLHRTVHLAEAQL